MDENFKSLDYLKIEIDGRTTIGILEQTFYYEKEDYSGELQEIQIPLKNIKELKYKDKTVDIEGTKENLIGDFIWTVLSSGAYPTTVEQKYPEIFIKYVVKGDRNWKSLNIKNRLLTEEMFNQLKTRIKIIN